MSERLDALHGIKNPRTEKTYWTKIGIAMPSKSGGYTLYLDYMPLTKSEDGKVMIALKPPREREDDRGNTRDRAPAKRDDSRRDDLDDSMPF
jgi:hypothetical protein